MAVDENAPTAESLQWLVRRATMVRISTSIEALTERKRRRRRGLVETVGEAGLVDLQGIVGLRCGPLHFWMMSPELWLEFVTADGAPGPILGYRRHGWLTWEAFGQAELTDPDAFVRWLAAWAPVAAAALEHLDDLGTEGWDPEPQ